MSDLDNTKLNDQNLEEETEELSFITMVDDQGRTETFEYLGEVDYKDKTYIAVLPVDEEDTDEGEEIFFLEVEDDNEKGETYVTVEDDDLLDEIYEVFKEENSDIYDFE